MDDDEKLPCCTQRENILNMLREAVCTCCRENEFCVWVLYWFSIYSVIAAEYFPSPDTLIVYLMAVNSLLVIIILTARFAKSCVHN